MDITVVVDGWRLMGPGLAMTLLVSISVMALGLVVGLLGGLSLLFGPRLLRLVVRGYVDFVRGTPLLVLIFLIFYGIPAVGIPVPNFVAAVISLGAFAVAHISVVVCVGISSIPNGQIVAYIELVK